MRFEHFELRPFIIVAIETGKEIREKVAKSKVRHQKIWSDVTFKPAAAKIFKRILIFREYFT